jgi:hypothetical protein
MRWSVVVGYAWLLAGCVVVDKDDDGTLIPADGTVNVTWQVGPTGCEASGVSSVEIAWDSGAQTFSCEDEAATFTAEPGRYLMSFTGLDAGGQARYGGEADVSVYSGQVTTVPTVVLSALPATVVATWRFENGALCASNGVESVDLNLFDQDDKLEQSLEVPCNDGIATLIDVDAGSYTLLVLGRDAAGLETFSGQVAIEAEKGDLAEVEVVLVEEL